VLEVNVHVDVVLVVVLVSETGFGLQLTRLTPLGLDVDESVMLPVKPLVVDTVTVDVPVAPTLKLTGLVAVIVKDVVVQVNVTVTEWTDVPVAAVPVTPT
jgi:hypothetical protein